jgi:hypothetical protein
MNDKGKRMKIGGIRIIQSFWRRKLEKKTDTRPTCNLLTGRGGASYEYTAFIVVAE